MQPALKTEDGSVTLTVVVLTVALLAFIGLVIDAGGKASAAARAEQVASEAARAAAQSVTPATMGGQAATVDASSARAAAQSYLGDAGVAGSVTVNGATVVVTTRDTYSTQILSIIGLNQFDVDGRAEITLEQR